MKPAKIVKTKCDCGHVAVSNGITTGYAIDQQGEKRCFDCCAIFDRQTMIKEGHSKLLPLYLVKRKIQGVVTKVAGYEVTNWPGTLRFKVKSYQNGDHNMTGNRIDIWFDGPDGYEWHGVSYGRNTQIVHCKRTKVKLEGKQ